jgi:chromosome segregation ATPase
VKYADTRQAHALLFPTITGRCIVVVPQAEERSTLNGDRLAAIEQTLQQFAAGQQSIGQQLESIDGRLGGIDGRLDRIDGRLDRIDDRLDRVDGQLDRVDGQLDRVDGRFDRVDGRLDRVDGRFDRIDGRLDKLEINHETLSHEMRLLAEAQASSHDAMTRGFNDLREELDRRLGPIETAVRGLYRGTPGL